LTVVWCDQSIGSNTNSNDDTNTLLQLARIVNKKRQLIHTFTEIDPCREFIKHVNNICLIISGSFGKKLVPLVHDLIQIHSIYVFCMDKQKHDEWARQYPKICGVFTNINEICECLKNYFITQTSLDYEQLQFDFFNKDLILSTFDRREYPFIYSLLSKMILSNMKSIKQEDMIEFCRTEFSSQYQTHLIDEFETNYLQHNPIWWFTRDSFFQGIINRALQIHDLYTLSMMNPFIRNLDLKLSELRRQQLSTSPKQLLLYISQSISKNDLNKLKLNNGGFMSINQFIFANTDKAIALMFIQLQSSETIDTNHVNVIFEISISQTNSANVSYANIGAISEFVHEKEYLLSMSSIFRIDKIEEFIDIPSMWSVQLTLIDKNHPQLIKLNEIINREYFDQDDDLEELGINLIDRFYQFKSTRKLYEQQLNFKTEPIRSVLLHYNMGIIYDCLSKYDKALEEYKYAINLTRNIIPNGLQEDRVCLIPLYSNMGLTYQQLNQHKHAFDHAYRTLNILSKDGANTLFKKELSASSHFNLGLILDLQGKNQEAKTHYEQALKNRMEYLPNNHRDVIDLQKLIASLSSQSNESAD
jgi:tetratricopeptide (TPR) repeat protein